MQYRKERLTCAQDGGMAVVIAELLNEVRPPNPAEEALEIMRVGFQR